jgi:hypothetical protein
MTKPKRTLTELDFAGEGPWVTIANAARLKGVTPRSIRNALDDKRLLNKRYKLVRGSRRSVLMVLTKELEEVSFRECKQPKRGKR